MPERIAYRKGYKYQLAVDYEVALRDLHIVRPRDDPWWKLGLQDSPHIGTEWVTLDHLWVLRIKKGYAWDGASGPARDTPSIMRAALVHDALYQLIRVGCLDKAAWRPRADKELRRICREDGMSWLRAWYIYRAVRVGGGKAASPAGIKPVLYAPRKSI